MNRFDMHILFLRVGKCLNFYLPFSSRLFRKVWPFMALSTYKADWRSTLEIETKNLHFRHGKIWLWRILVSFKLFYSKMTSCCFSFLKIIDRSIFFHFWRSNLFFWCFQFKRSFLGKDHYFFLPLAGNIRNQIWPPDKLLCFPSRLMSPKVVTNLAFNKFLDHW